MTITLNPNGAESWFAGELGDLFDPGNLVTFEAKPGSTKEFQLSQG